MLKSAVLVYFLIFSIRQFIIAVSLHEKRLERTAEEKSKSLQVRSFLTNAERKWPIYVKEGKQTAIVPYETPELEPVILNLIKQYIEEFNQKSCVRWVPKSDNDTSFVTITSGDVLERGNASCWSYVGDMKLYSTHQYLFLSSECLRLDDEQGKLVAAIPHEMMHTLGFIHEHERKDRDCYISIPANESFYFPITTEEEIEESFPYDTKSIMHVPRNYYNITSKFGEELVGTNDSLSDLDWVKLNYMYCGGSHICDLDLELCEKHKKIKEECKSNGIMA